ncbi:hypothetical protein LXA43DRAFT_1059205 [Ganoderma leucocontextum]|nr:hypothetical protein LXA43DRAFT_1059205 [Ganoderma leucocontextum]
MRTVKGHSDERELRPSKSPPISRLPTELLSSVFAMLADLEELRTIEAVVFGLSDGIHVLMNWVRLMLVCRHWRNVGISSPWLWRRISVTRNLQSLEYRLSRTVGCTIDVFLSKDAITNELAMPLLLPVASKVRSIQTDDSFCFDALPSIKPLFQVLLPSLESITLLPEEPMVFQSEDDHSDEAERWFDLGLSGDLHPRLCKLHICRIVIPPPPAFFSALRDLVIDVGYLETPPLCPQDVVNILVHSPRLEVFKIFSPPIWNYPSGLQVPADIEPGRQSRWGLPHLREIFFKCPYDFAASILQVVDFPNLTVFRVEVFTSTPIDSAEIGSHVFLPSLRHIAHRFTELRIVPNEPSGFYIGGTASLVPGHSRNDRNRFRADIAIQDFTRSIVPLDAALNTLCSVFAGASLKRLDIADFKTNAPSPSAWKCLHTTFPTLDTLRIACSAPVVRSFLEAFVALSMEGSWLALRHLSLNTALRGCSPLDSSALHDIFALVLDALRARRESNANTLLGLEHAMESSTPLCPHRWMLHSMSSLCGGFGFRRCNGDSPHFVINILDLFQPAELRRLSEEAPEEAAGASDQTSKNAIQTGDSAEGEAESDSSERETNTHGDLHSDDKGTAAAPHGDERDEGECDEYSQTLTDWGMPHRPFYPWFYKNWGLGNDNLVVVWSVAGDETVRAGHGDTGGVVTARQCIPRWLGQFENMLKTNPITVSAQDGGRPGYLVGSRLRQPQHARHTLGRSSPIRGGMILKTLDGERWMSLSDMVFQEIGRPRIDLW